MISAVLMKSRLVALLFVMLACCGCVITSVNPFYTPDILAENQSLFGNWRLTKNGSHDDYENGTIEAWVISKDRIVTFDEKGRKGIFDCHLFKIDGGYYFDLYPWEADLNEFWGLSIWPLHILVKVSLDNDQLILTPLNYAWFEEKQKSGELKLSVVKPDDGELKLYTSKSEEWVGVLKKYQNEKDFFREDKAIVLKKEK